jgi:hypothetical protein
MASTPMPTARISARKKMAASSRLRPAPKACATRPVVPERRKFMVVNRMSKMMPPTAMAPIRAASPSCPMVQVSARPTNGVEMNASVIGAAIANTERWVTGKSSACVAGRPVISDAAAAQDFFCGSMRIKSPSLRKS